VVAALADADGDGVADATDLCPLVSDPAQGDGDEDGVGDACDRQVCGNGVVESDESCDDSNRNDGDGCPATCRQACSPAPLPGCIEPTRAGAASLEIVDALNDRKDRLLWRLGSAAATTTADIGDPASANDLVLCVYNPVGLVLEARIPAGGTCGRKSCWQVKRKGARYRNPASSPDGIDQVHLAAGSAGRAKARVHGKGVNLRVPPLPLALPLQVQLQSEAGRCWSATYTEARRNDARKLLIPVDRR
jgi:cysteine-rich repeat protein